jgi:hypothetical protein
MKHELVELIEASIENGVGTAIDLLEQFNRGDYDYGQDRMEENDVSSEEQKLVRMETENRLNDDVNRAYLVSGLLKTMEVDDYGLFTEKSFSELLLKKDDDDILVLDIEGMMGEMCRVVIPAIIQHGVERYAAACLQWLFQCEQNNIQWFVGQDVIPALEKMKEANALKMEFCFADGGREKNGMAL